MFISVMIRTLALFIMSIFSIYGCSSNIPASPFGKCISCHTMTIDENHTFKCTKCHNGIDTAEDKDRAHLGLESNPAHPEKMGKYCTTCHEKIITGAPKSIHFTLKKSTNMFRSAFGAQSPLASFIETPVITEPSTPIELGDDLLRRRCFKCHLYDSGQGYPATTHGQGCAACHFSVQKSEQDSHFFTSPTDEHCLSCHYGNYVGYDYYGRFEHDFNVEYRTPYTTKNEHFRPYGIEFRQLSPDVHKQKGLACIDCHSGNELMLQGAKPSCNGCHDRNLLVAKLPPKVSLNESSYYLTAHSGKAHLIPTMNHPAHFSQTQKIACQACHAQWSFDDRGKHYIRTDSDDLDSFSALTVQGNQEIETLLTNNFDFDKEELPISMTDTLTGEASPGIWLKGYVTRRWEKVRLGRDDNGRITVVRPILDYSLSWINEDDTVIFDAVQPIFVDTTVEDYTPHTTGSAGLFYTVRIQQFLTREKQSQIDSSNSIASPPQ